MMMNRRTFLAALGGLLGAISLVPSTTLARPVLDDEGTEPSNVAMYNDISGVIEHNGFAEFNDPETRKGILAALYPVAANYFEGTNIKYEFVCDETNNTPEVIDANNLFVDLIYSGIKVRWQFVGTQVSWVETPLYWEENE